MRKLTAWCGFLLLAGAMVSAAEKASTTTVRILVQDFRGVAIGSQAFLVRGEQGEVRPAVTDPEGCMTLELPAGEYELFRGNSNAPLAGWSVDPERQPELEIEVRIETSSDGDQPPGREENTVRLDTTGALAAIASYRVLQKEFGERGVWDRPSEVFNPFQAKRSRRFHGSVYEYHRNDNLDARNFFDPVGQKLPEFKRNQFGIQLGGEMGGSLSLLGSYDGLRIVRGSTIVSHVPSAAQKQGDFSDLGATLRDPFSGQPLAGNRIPRERIHPVAQKLLALFPDPNRADTERNFVNSRPRIEDSDTFTFRADYQVDEATEVLGRYTLSRSQEVDVEPLPSFFSREEDQRQSLTLTLNRTFSPRFTAEARFRIRRNVNRELANHAGETGLLESLGIPGLTLLDPSDEGYPDFRISGYAPFGDGNSPRSQVRNRFTTEVNLTYAFADHNLEFSSEISWEQFNDVRSGEDRRGTFSFGGSFTGDAFADFLLGLPESAERATGSDRVDLRRRVFEFGLSDDWRVSPHLNLDLGVTYAYYEPYPSTRPVASFFPLLVDPEGNGQVVISGSDEANRLGFSRAGRGSLIFPDRNDWAPRLGLAYSPTGTNRFVIRTSYSIFYQPLQSWQAINFMARNYPFYQREEAVSSIETPQLDLSNPFQTIAPTAVAIRGIERNVRTSSYQFWRLTVEKKVSRNWSLDLSYIGRKGTGLKRIIPGNVPLPGPGVIQERRPDPDYGLFTIISGGASSISHALDLQVERQLARGYSLKGGVTWDREISDLVFFGVSNPRDLRSERAPSGWRPDFSAFLNYIVDLPFGEGRDAPGSGFWGRLSSGWRWSGITRFQGGRAFSVRLATDLNNDGLSSDRPDRIGDGRLPAGQRSIDAWFDVGAFAEPAEYSFGNAGRNILRGLGFENWDMALSKRTVLADGHFLEFRLELFNAFNHTNFDDPEATFGTSVFGQIFGAARAREIEIALKYSF